MKTTRASYLILAPVVLACLALPLARGAGTINAKPETGTAAAAAATPDAAPATPAAAVSADKGKTNSAAINAAPGQLPIPVSVFDLAATPAKDPFFPKTLRHPITEKTGEKATLAISAHSFQLMSLGGSTGVPLAMINRRTGTVGEALEVLTSNGTKATIRIVQIKETSVIIRVISPPQPDLIELSLSRRAQ